MLRIIKISLVIFVLLFFVSFNTVYALDMDLDNNQTNQEDNTSTDDEQDSTSDTTNDNDSGLDTPDDGDIFDNLYGDEGDPLTPSQTTNTTNNDSGLGTGNVLNILLIVVGFVLVLLGIAIIIRLK